MQMPEWTTSCVYQQQVGIYKQTLTQEIAQYICSLPEIPDITKLILNKVNFERGAISQLTQTNWDSLISINIWAKQERLKEEELEQLTNASFSKLKWLEIAFSSLTAAGCKQLAAADWHVEDLQLGHNLIDDQACMNLAAAKWELKSLSLWRNKIGLKGFKSLVEWQIGKPLISLNLNHNLIGDKGCKLVMKARWKQLQQLSLCQNNITWIGCKWLAKSEWKKLQQLALKWNDVRWRGVKELSGCEWLSLQYLSVQQYEQVLETEIIRLLMNLCAPKVQKIAVGQSFISDTVEMFLSQMKAAHPCFYAFKKY